MAQAICASSLIKVPMAGIGYGRAPAELETLLGSCVGIAIFDRTSGLGALAHVVLPDSRGATETPGKYADTAIATMKHELLCRGAMPVALVAKIAGGATMFGQRTAGDVGAKNCEAVRAHLAEHKIRLIAEHIGGDKGRVILFNLADASVQVRIGRETVAVI
ncbi:MAG: chemotaxis protein CheD [Pirellulales bacterium]|nr:chemotaxis protein CheD [Pirellulales bacterium]